MTAMNQADTAYTVEPLHVPADADGPDAADFRTMIEIRNRVVSLVLGEQAQIVTPHQALPAWQDDSDEETIGFLVRADGQPIGRALLYLPTEEGSTVAEPHIEIVPEHQGRGAGRLAFARLEQTAREHGRTTLQSWTNHRQLGGERLTASTGWGSIPVGHVSRSLLAAGYALGQVYRASALDLTASMGRIVELRDAAQAAAPGYRYVSWGLPTPPDRREGFARMKARMSTDAPAGDISFEEETWDAARIERLDARLAAQGFTRLLGAIEHIDTGELVAYNELVHIGAPDANTTQMDTLVLKEHRGHRLGMLVKCENLLRWREFMPQSPRVTTNNAEENRPMLDINEAMGFAPIAYAGAWQKLL